MFWSDKVAGTRIAGTAARSAGNPLPPKIAALLRESWWLALLAIALYLFLILATYSQSDPGWSHSVRTPAIHNAGGVVGAYLADLMQTGKMKPVIDRTYKSLSETPQALVYLEEGHARGKVVINVE